jgi:hypothetical protein
MTALSLRSDSSASGPANENELFRSYQRKNHTFVGTLERVIRKQNNTLSTSLVNQTPRAEELGFHTVRRG